jgi:hypothetical protein
MENNSMTSSSLRSLPATQDLTVFTLEQAIEAVKRARDEVQRTLEVKDELGRELDESNKHCVELQAQLDEHEHNQSDHMRELHVLREDKALILEMLGLSDHEWELTRNNYDRAAHIANVVRQRPTRFIDLVVRTR